MKIFALLLCLAASALALAACQTMTVTNETSTRATWKYALISIPKEMTTTGTACVGVLNSAKAQDCIAQIAPDREYPLILFMHGCAGLTSSSRNLITNFRQLGYAVIAPDSFTRLGREKECVSSSRKRFTISLRKAEIAYALTQIPTLEWVDQSRLVLAGHSEGGNTVAEYNGPDVFAGYIMTGWDCRTGLYPSGPILAVRGVRDEIANQGNCSSTSSTHSQSVIVPGAGHDVSGYRETQVAFESFLTAVAPKE